ncbi:MAG TPA: prolyl oligopeptidase family serine peptidase [Pirellulales bacterium]|jgi:dienelactone hydrolase
MPNNRQLCHFTAIFLFLLAIGSAPALAQTKSGSKGNAKSVPPSGIDIPAADRAELERGLSALDASIAQLATSKDARTVALLPDVQIFQRAVSTALKNNEVFAIGDVPKAKELLKEGQTRADQLLRGEAPWTRATGLVVRGYVSKIDGSVQPYGLVVPISCRPESAHIFRLDVWLHGRSETLSEVNFLDDRMKKPGEFTPQDTIVLHPYGRYCNAFKFAGEIDVLEAIDAVKKQYRIDDDRIAMRGFSMGGAGCWHLAVHYADRWFAATPGAGFAETEEYLKMSDATVNALPPWQRKLFEWYDCPLWAANLYHCPTISYNGEDDPQKQSGDVMEEALKAEGIALRRITAPHTQHRYTPEAKETIEAAVDSIAETGRDRMPTEVHLVTYTLRYSRMFWVQVDGLGEHWTEAHVNAALSSGDDQSVVTVETENVTDLTLTFPPGWSPFDVTKPVQVAIDDQELDAPRMFSDRSWSCQLHKAPDPNDKTAPEKWVVGSRETTGSAATAASSATAGLRKRPGLQGPIDDAFMDSFIMVRPTGKSSHAAVNQWTQAEMDRALREWRRQFRGDARVKDDTAITADDIANANLVLWGDAESNAVIKRIADKLPIRTTGENIVVDRDKFTAADHVPALIYPNPLNPKKYVVLNSGVTFREADYASNAMQVPRLPDWAIIDIHRPPSTSAPGKISAAGFFGEQWELNPTGGKAEKNKTAGWEPKPPIRTSRSGWLGSTNGSPQLNNN